MRLVAALGCDPDPLMIKLREAPARYVREREHSDSSDVISECCHSTITGGPLKAPRRVGRCFGNALVLAENSIRAGSADGMG